MEALVAGLQWQQERLKHVDFTAEGLAQKRQISALTRQARETMETIGSNATAGA